MNVTPILRGITGSSAWASIPAASGFPAGTLWYVTDIGAAGSYWISNGTRWTPMGGRLTLKNLGAPVTGVANSETIVLQTLIPAGMLQTNDLLRILVAASKSGTTDSMNMNVRVGTAGTTSDTAVNTGTGALAAPSRNLGLILDFSLASATTLQRNGVSTANLGSYTGTSTTATPSAVTISSAAANALYVSVSIASSSTNNTVAIQAGQIELVTP